MNRGLIATESPAAVRAAFARLNDAQRLAALTEVNLDDLVEAFGLASHTQLARGARSLGRGQARRFARIALDMDRAVGQAGLAAGSAWGLGALSTSLAVVGRGQLPDQGPLLFVANHPGMTDTIALFAAIGRADLRTIAAHRAFLALLPNLSAPLIWVSGGQGEGLGALRTAAAHLRAGGAVLTFPGGRIEPDPALQRNFPAALTGWNRSLNTLARMAPHAQIVPTLVSGVISTAAARHPLRLLRRTQEGRDLLSAMLQLAVPAYKSVAAEVRFGAPLPIAALSTHADGAVQTAVIALMQALEAQRSAARLPAE